MSVQVQERFTTTLRRLSRLSTGRGFDAYRDVPWDDEDHRLDPTDPRLRLPALDPLASTDWYRSLDPTEQARVGLARITTSMTTARQFENLLQQGLLHRALYMRTGDPEFRYIHHEVIEEAQHTLMFEELVVRAGAAPRGMPKWLRRVTESLMPVLARHSPVVFFAMVLGGEEPLDLIQRRTVAEPDVHPLVQQVMRIHIAEEARHISYARTAIEVEAPQLSRARRHSVAFFTPLALGIMARLMLRPNHDLAAAGVPREVLRAVDTSDEGRRLLVDGVARIRRLYVELDLVTAPARWMWRRLGLWPTA